MVRERFDDGDGIQRSCSSCGKGWPASYSACPDDGAALMPRTATSTVDNAQTVLVPPRGQPPEHQGAIEGGTRVDSFKRLVDAAPGAPRGARRQGPFLSEDLEHDTDRRVEELSVVSVSEMTPVMRPDWDRTTIPPTLATAGTDDDAVEPKHTPNTDEKAGVSELTPMPTRVWDGATIVVPPDARTDAVAVDRGQATKLSIGAVIASARNPFDSEDSDARTPAVGRKPHEEQPSSPPGSKSSDPPTAFVRRAERHIELPPGSAVDEYEIDHRLGAGAMGEVYSARYVKLGKRVAIKVISPRLSQDAAAIERFEQEARTLARMRHPGLVDVIGFGELADGRAYFVMEYLSGESLFDRLARGRLAEHEALDVFDQMTRALEAAHQHNVIHRDLKPENTFLVRVANEQRPIVKLLDFGLALLAADVDQRAERTQSGVVIGTAMYLSPEQARGPNVDGRTDVYALGCVGYEVFLGLHPFHDARTVAALIAAHMHETPPMPRSISPRIPPQLDLLLFAMLAKDPAYRPTLAQVRAVIAGVRSPAPTFSTPPRLLAPVGARGQTTVAPHSSRATFVIAGAAMLAGIVIGAASLGSRSSGDKPAASGVPSPAEDMDGGVGSAATASSVTDAEVSVVEPPPAIDAGAPPRVASVRRSSAGSVVPPIDAGSPVVATPRIDAAAPETQPVGAIVIDAAVEPTATIEIDAPATPATVPLVHRTPRKPLVEDNPYKPKVQKHDRNQTVNPFLKKPASR